MKNYKRGGGMEELEGKKISEYNYEIEFIQIIKIFIYSFIGIIVFFIPIRLDGETKTLIYHIANKVQNQLMVLLQICIICFTAMGCFKSILEYKRQNTNKLYVYIRFFSILILINLFFGKQSCFFIKDNTALLIKTVILDLATVLPISAIFMPFLLEYGLMDIVEAYFQVKMKKIFKLSGKTIINILIYIFTDCFCGIFMTNKLYKDGKIRANEASILSLNFSIMSFSMINYISNELNLNKLQLVIIGALILVLSNIILCRIRPLSKVKKSYFIKTSYKETRFRKNKFNNAINKYLKNRCDKNIFNHMIQSFEESVKIIMYIIPDIVIVLFLGDMIINSKLLIPNLVQLLSNAIKVLKLSGINQVSSIIVYGFFNDIIAIDMVDKSIEYSTRLLIGLIMILKCTSLSSQILYIKESQISINMKQIFIIYIEKILIIMCIYLIMHYFYIGYIM
ncbi:hypothetical protein CHF27_000510 [Romboutsia maritimum]|uniref:Nucleoside transporter/FeoB GTPase Gate domain-containing protein n=1 Tax=Romboutsia maritimum TaxID=2020948 RepID=A0A371IW51_9FIRM|nr:hypothetical protein [Romboutsia maritimum]RDY24714.1 hypothetical protein CHF27_000510 [Romboutsia maritimum]